MIKKYLLVSVIVFILSGCGYKPASWYAKEAIQGDVFVDVVINVVDPRNAVLVKDAMNEIIISKFGNKLTKERSKAQTIVTLKLGTASLTAIQYNPTGYVRLYRSRVPVEVTYNNKNKKGAFTITGEHDFSIGDDTVISDSKRFEAIKNAASDALDEIVSRLAVEAYRR